MIYKNAQFDESPATVKLETLPTGAVNAWLTKNVREETTEADSEQPSKSYVCDMVFFTLSSEDSERVTTESVTADFANWWAYGEAWVLEPSPASLEQRLSDLENAFVESLGL